MKKSCKKLIFAALILSVVVFSGCVGYGSTGGTQTSAAPNSVNIQDFAFAPSTMTIKVGTTITWTNMDSAPHTVVSNSGSEISSETLSNGQKYSHTFNTPGTFAYHCGVHTSMKGTIIVE